MGRLLTHIILTPAAMAAAAALLAGCNNVGCTDNQSSVPLAGFYDYGTGREVTLAGLTLGGIGAPNDSLLLRDANAMTAYLPFRADRDTVTFRFDYAPVIIPSDNDTVPSDTLRLHDLLTFAYTSTPYLASEDCGVTYRYRIRSVSHTDAAIDSVGIAPTDSVIDNVEIQRIRIYFRTRSQQ